MSEIPRASLDTVKEVLAGYSKTSEVGEPISDEEVGEARDVNSDVARRQKKFFVDLGILEKDGYDHLLTESGGAIGELLRFNQAEEAAEKFRELLLEWEPKDEILSHVDGEISKEDLADKIALVTQTDLSTWRHEAGAGAIIDLFEETGFIKEDTDGNYRRLDGEPEAATVDEETKEEESQESPASPSSDSDPDPVQSSGISADGPAPPEHDTGVAINLDVSGTDDPENVRQLLLAIRKGSQEDVENYETPD